MSQFLLYFKFEPYLAQWFIHEMGGTSPVELPRGSVESDILQLFLDKQPEDMPDEKREDANLVTYAACAVWKAVASPNSNPNDGNGAAP